MNKENTILVRNEFIEVTILGDWICFYRCLSMHIEYSQENHIYYRNLIFNYINSNEKLLQYFFPKEENEDEKDYINIYDNFISSINNLCNYSGNFEISAASNII